jgi:repressor LexA
MRLTKRDEDILEYIKDYMKRTGVTPTIREIASGVGLYSTASAYSHFSKLNEMGYITQIDRRYTVRGMRYVEDNGNGDQDN